MKKKLLFVVIAILTFTLAFTSCSLFKGSKEISGIEIVDGTLKREFKVNEIPDFSGLRVIVKYNDDSTKTVEAKDLQLSTIDTSKAGTKTLSITYEGHTIKVDINVVAKDDGGNNNANQPTVTKIEIDKTSVASKLYKGETLDTSDIKVMATYSDNTVKAVDKALLTIGSIDTATAGKKTLTVTYGDKQASVEITVIEITSMTVVSDTIATTVDKGASLYTAGLQVSVVYSDETNEIVGADKLTIGSIDTTTHGDKVLEITYKGVKITQKVHVKGIVELKIVKVSNSVIVKGQHDLSGLEVLAKYSDGTEKTISNTLLTKNAISTDTAGEKKFSVAYDGVTSNEVTVNVIGVKSMAIATGSVNNAIIIGEAHTLENVKVNVTLTDNTNVVVNYADLTVTGAVNNSVAGENTVKFAYLDGSVDFVVTVYGMTGIELDTSAVVTVLEEGTPASLQGLVVKAVYGNGQRVEVTDWTSDITDAKFDWNTAGEKEVTVSYSGFTKIVKFVYEEPELESIEVVQYTSKAIIGKGYDKSNVVIKATFSNGNTATVNANALTITDIDTSVAGAKTLTVSYTDPTYTNITKSADVTVTVYGVKSVGIGGLTAKVININETFDYSALVVTVTYEDDSFENVALNDANLVITNIDTSSVGTKQFNVSYYGVAAAAYEVVVRDVESIRILGGSFDANVRKYFPISKSNLVIEITYTNGDIATLNYVGNESLISVALPDTSDAVEPMRDPTTGTWVLEHEASGYKWVPTSKDITVSYNGKTATVSVAIMPISHITMVIGSVAPEINPGSTLITAGMQATAYFFAMEDGSVVMKSFVIGAEWLDFDASSINTGVPGEQALKVTFKNRSDIATSLNITVRGVEEIFVDNAPTAVKVGDTTEAITGEGITITVKYNTGMFVSGVTTGVTFDFSGFNTAAAGTTSFVVNYGGKSVTVTVDVIDASISGVICGVSLPAHINAVEGYKKNFKDQSQPYVVGDDNPYVLKLIILALNSNMDLVESDGNYVSASKVYLNDAELTGEELSKYVSIDENKNSFDFTEAAIGKTFKIVTGPASAPQHTRSQTVTVVDGYNIYRASELNLITNHRDTYGPEAEEKVNLAGVAQILYDKQILIPSANGGYYLNTRTPDEEQIKAMKASLDTIKSVVIHGNLNVTVDDIPTDYVGYYTPEGSNGTVPALYDLLFIFYHEVTATSPNFKIYGNYYTITSASIPSVGPDDRFNNGDGLSNSSLFMFSVADNLLSASHDVTEIDSLYNSDNYETELLNLAMRDNDPNSNIQEDSERHMRGLLGIKTRLHKINITNTNITSYFISYMADCDNQTVTIKNSDFYNAWQNHIFIYSNNYLQEKVDADPNNEIIDSGDEPPAVNHKPIVINIENSRVAKCGGPVIISQSDDRKDASNRNSYGTVNVDDASEIYTYVTGQEAWFIAFGQTQLATQIMALNQAITGTAAFVNANYSAALGGITFNASFTTNKQIQNVDTMNLIMINMKSGTSIGAAEEGEEPVQGELHIGGATVLNMNHHKDKNPNATVNYMVSATGGQAPVFQSSNGVACYFNGSALAGYGENSNLMSFLSSTQQCGANNDYISLYYMGVGIALGYFH